MLNGVVHKVDDNLNNQPCVTFRKQQFLFMVDADGMFDAFSVYMGHGFRYNLLHQMRLHFQFHTAFLYFRNRQKIFHQIVQPGGIVINIPIHLLLRIRIQRAVVCQQDAGIAGNRSEGCAQIVRN